MAHVKQAMPPDPTGHDWPHVLRVLKNALYIHKAEGGNEFIVSLVALTHDLYDHKFFTGTQGEAEKNLAALLHQYGIDGSIIPVVVDQAFNLSFKGGAAPEKQLSLEGKIVQDAD
ncbi:MAG TPA: phosphohydrolase, partial [Flavobacteriales bacterium]|nr:phosphohydrolase [Flavobacteriales bacterium]